MTAYFAKFHLNKDHQYEVSFPDLSPYASTFGDTLDDAIKSARDSLTGYLLTKEDYHEEIPKPTDNSAKFNAKSPDFIMPILVDLKLLKSD